MDHFWNYGPQALVLNSCSDPLFFVCLTVHIIFKMWPVSNSSVNWPASTLKEKTPITKVSHCCMEVNMETTKVSVYGFVYKLMCSKSQQIHAQIKRRMSMRRKRANFLGIFAFCGAVAANSVCRCALEAGGSGIVTGITSLKRNFRMSRTSFNYICDSCQLRIVTNVNLKWC